MHKLLLFLSLLSTQLYPYSAVLYDGTSASSHDKLLAMTLAGIVNRDSARLFLMNVYETWSYSQTDETWRDLYKTRGNVTFTVVNTIPALLAKFNGFINGAITYDQNRTWGNFSGQSFRWQGEYAALIGGLSNRLPCSPSLAASYGLNISDSVLITDSFDGDSPVWVTGKIDNTLNPWNNTSLSEENRYLTMLNWGVQNLLPRCNPGKFYIREITDFTVKYKIFQVNLAGTSSLDLNSVPAARADILENVLNFLQNKNNGKIFHIYGWIVPEPMTQWFAFFGSSFHETLLGNLSWHSSFPVEERTYIPPAKTSPNEVNVENKYYIVFITSEGDAGNWNIGFQSGGWLSSQRGNAPVSWGWNLHILDLCPFIASYYYDTATPNDGFLSVTSPLGYAYPDLWGSQFLSDATYQSKRLMDKFNIRDIYAYKHYAGAGTMTYRGKVINNSFDFIKLGQFQSAIKANITFLFDPKLNSQTYTLGYGTLMWDHHADDSFYGDVSNLQNTASNIINELKKKTKPGFLLAGYQRMRYDNATVSSGSSDITIPRLKQLIQYIKADTSIGQNIEVVTTEKFSALLRKYLNYNKADNEKNLPSAFELSQNYPNPFNPTTTISLYVPDENNIAGDFQLTVYDLLGNKIKTLLNQNPGRGYHLIEFNGADFPSGIYFYQLKTGKSTATKKMMLIK